MLTCLSPILLLDFFAISPITINIRIITEHSLQRETISLALSSTMYCSGFLCRGGEKIKKKKNMQESVPGLSFSVIDPIFLIVSHAVESLSRWQSSQREVESTVVFKLHRRNVGTFFKSHQTQDSCRFSLCLSTPQWMSLSPWTQLLFFSSFLLLHLSDLFQKCLFQSLVSPQLEPLSSCTTFPPSCIRCSFPYPKPLLKI